MKTKLPSLYLFVLLLVGAVGCTSTAGEASRVDPAAAPDSETEPAAESGEAEAAGVIVLSDISADEPAKKIERYQPMADYLAANLAEFGIGAGEVKIAPDLETMTQWMLHGEVDFYIDSLYPAMLICDASGAQPILRSWKDDVAEYHTVIFTRADSEITSLDDLKGQMIAFEEDSSTSGYMLPLAYLVEAGFNAVEKSSVEAAVAEDEVGYLFSGDDLNTLQWVLSGTAAAGATDDQSFAELVEESGEELVILAETESVARNVLIARDGLEPELIEAVKTLLTALDETPEGLELLDIFKTEQFDEFPEGASTAFARMRELYAIVEEK